MFPVSLAGRLNHKNILILSTLRKLDLFPQRKFKIHYPSDSSLSGSGSLTFARSSKVYMASGNVGSFTFFLVAAARSETSVGTLPRVGHPQLTCSSASPASQERISY